MMAKSYKDKLKELEEYGPPAPGEAVARRTRGRAAEATQSVATGQQPDPEKPAKLLEFQEVIESDGELDNLFHSLTMVTQLLRTSYRPGGDKLINAMGFDQKHLTKQMRVTFWEASGKNIEEWQVLSALRRKGRPTIQVLYEDILGLNEDSTKEEMKQKALTFTHQLAYMKEFLGYPSEAYVTDLLASIREAEQAGEPLSEEEKLSLVKEYNLGEEKRFDDDILDEKIEAMEAGTPTASPTDGTDAFYAKFYFENRDPMAPLEAFQNNFSSFYADEWVDLAPKLDAKFPEVLMGISLSLSTALTPGKNAADMIKAISVGFNTTDPEVLKQKVKALSQAIQELRPELYEESTPSTTPSGVTPEAEKPTMDYMKFYEDEIEGDEEMVEAYMPLFNLYYALKRGDEKFREKELKERLFGGNLKSDVMSEIDDSLGEGMAEAMEASAKAGKDDHVKIALIKAIAEQKGLVGKPEELKQELIRVKEALLSKFRHLSKRIS